MSDRDRWARLTPYEIGIPGRRFVERVFEAIREEAAARGVDPADPGAFLLLGEVGRALREIQGEERGGEALQRFGAFLFHAYHFHQAGEPLLLLETPAARRIVEGDPPAGSAWSGGLPAEAGYVQLPRHLFWSAAAGAEPAEPLDGFFWTRSLGDTLSLLVALGVRGDRPGISVMELPPLALSDGPRWLREPAREERGEDFATDLPGGELDRLYSVLTAGEVLKLAGRTFGHVEAKPDVLGAEEVAPRPEPGQESPVGSPPSLLPYRRIRGGGDDADGEDSDLHDGGGDG